MDTVLRGARHHRLPAEYVEWLESVEVGSGAV